MKKELSMANAKNSEKNLLPQQRTCKYISTHQTNIWNLFYSVEQQDVEYWLLQ